MHPRIKDLKEITLLEAFKLARLDLTKLIYLPSGGSGLYYEEFDISPKDFLRYAKIAFQTKTESSLIDAITNAKRAIDCQIDTVFNSMYVNHANLPKSLEQFVKCFKYDGDLWYKLKVMQALNLAPSILVSYARGLRHSLEHNYEIPEEKHVRQAIEIAELFIRSINGVLRASYTEFEITDKKNLIEDDNSNERYVQGLEISVGGGTLAVNGSILIRVLKMENNEHTSIAKVTLSPDNPLYFAIFRLLNSEDDSYELTESMRIIAKLMEHPIPQEQINVNM